VLTLGGLLAGRNFLLSSALSDLRTIDLLSLAEGAAPDTADATRYLKRPGMPVSDARFESPRSRYANALKSASRPTAFAFENTGGEIINGTYVENGVVGVDQSMFGVVYFDGKGVSKYSGTGSSGLCVAPISVIGTTMDAVSAPLFWVWADSSCCDVKSMSAGCVDWDVPWTYAIEDPSIFPDEEVVEVTTLISTSSL
jgi:hypothetical protein